jgi:hypothetical protein
MRCRVNAFNCHSVNDTGDLVTEPLSSNGRLLWFQDFGFQAARHNISNVQVDFLEGAWSNRLEYHQFHRPFSVSMISFISVHHRVLRFPGGCRLQLQAVLEL